MLLRRITKHVKEQNWFAVFLDFVIVVAGILIAFQVTNWSQARQENAAVDSYLTSMSKTIELDLNRLDALASKRVGLMGQARFLSDSVFTSKEIDTDVVQTGSEIFRNLSNYEYFYADQSVFDTFKSSGLLRNIQGYDVEGLIFRYYNLANEISDKEADFNQILKDAFSELSQGGFRGATYVMYPNFIGGAAELEQLQPVLREILHHPTALSVYSHAQDKSPELIIRYENLAVLGREIISIINDPSGDLARSSSSALDDYFEIESDDGYATPLVNGTIITRFFEWGHATANGRGPPFTTAVNQIVIEVPNVEWAVFYIRNRADAFSERPAKDFSRFSEIELTLRGALGGEEVFLALKDSTDLDDGLESRIPITLTSEWTTHRIPLSRFETADLGHLFVPMSFVFLGGGQTVYVKDIEFLK